MAGSGSGSSGGGGSGAGSSSGSLDVTRLYRREVVITDADLRLDIAGYVQRIVSDDLTVSLDSEARTYRNQLTLSRGARDVSVNGTYSSHVVHSDMRLIGDKIVDTVTGDMVLKAQIESETLMAGAYVNTLSGAYLRVCAWADFLCWGGWVEVDLCRIEIAGAMIRAYWAYAHAMLIRLTRGSIYVDDFEHRMEVFGFLDDSHMTKFHVGTPSADTLLEA